MAKFLLRALKAGERGRAEAPHVKSDDRDGAPRATRCPSAPITALLFKSLNLSYPGLEAVKAAIAAGDQDTACDAVAQYYAASKHAPWLRHAAPAAGTALAGGAVDAVMLNDTYLLRQTFLLTLSPFAIHRRLVWRSRYDFYGEVGRVKRNADGGLDWYDQGPDHDREFMFALNRMGSWDQLLGAWLSTGNPQYDSLYN